MSDLTCEWNQHSDDGQHEGTERCTDCLADNLRPGLAVDCQALAAIHPHCPTCDCRPERRHDEGFVACDDHLDQVMAKVRMAP